MSKLTKVKKTWRGLPSKTQKRIKRKAKRVLKRGDSKK